MFKYVVWFDYKKYVASLVRINIGKTQTNGYLRRNWIKVKFSETNPVNDSFPFHNLVKIKCVCDLVKIGVWLSDL